MTENTNRDTARYKKTLYVGNLESSVTEEEIISVFKEFNPECVKKHHRDLRCFAFVQLSSLEDVVQAIGKLNQTVFNGRRLILRPYCEKEGAKKIPDVPQTQGARQDIIPATKPGETVGDEDSMSEGSIYITNLPLNVTEEDLQYLLEGCDPGDIRIHQSGTKCAALVKLRTSYNTAFAFSKINGSFYRGRKLICRVHTVLRNPQKPLTSAEKLLAFRTPESTESDGGKDTADTHLFIGNFPYGMTELDLYNLFKDYEPVNVRRFQHDIKCFAFVKLRSPEKVQLAIDAINGMVYKGRRLICKVNKGTKKPHVEDEIRLEVMKNILERDKNLVHGNTAGLMDKGVCKTTLPDLVAKDKQATEDRQSPDSDGCTSGKRILIENIPPGSSNSKMDLHNPVKDHEPEHVIKFQHNRKHFAHVALPSAEDTRSADLENIDTEVLTQASDEKAVYVANLPDTVTEEEIATLVENFDPIHINKHHDGGTCGAVVQLVSSGMVSRAVQQLHGAMFRGQRLSVRSVSSDDHSEQLDSQMPELEYISSPGFKEVFKTYFGKCLSPMVPFFKEAIYTMPMEMRGGFLCCMLRDCTKDLTWLPAIMNMSGEVSLLVTNVFPNSPYFWAVLVQEVVDNLPYLSKREVHRGLRCLAQCVLFYGEDMTWNRCWVVDVNVNHAIVYMLDYGITATVPIQCLRPLDSDIFWITPPLAQPFFSQGGFKCIDFLGTFIDGEISGSCLNERHVLMFTKHAHKE